MSETTKSPDSGSLTGPQARQAAWDRFIEVYSERWGFLEHLDDSDQAIINNFIKDAWLEGYEVGFAHPTHKAEIDRLHATMKAAAEVCRNADRMNSLGPIQALAIALDREVTGV